MRKREDLLELFESILNLVVRHAPQAMVAFNNKPDDIADAVSRRLGTKVSGRARRGASPDA